MTRRPFVRDKNLGIGLGVAAFLLGSFFLWDAWEGRGGETPKLMRPFAWW